MNPNMAVCCENPANRERMYFQAAGRDAKDGVIARWQEVCKVCGRNHYGMDVEPVQLGLTL